MLARIADLCVQAQNLASTAKYDEHRALRLQQGPLQAAYAHRAVHAAYDKHIAVSLLCLPFT